jgi:hypothetical protein
MKILEIISSRSEYFTRSWQLVLKYLHDQVDSCMNVMCFDYLRFHDFTENHLFCSIIQNIWMLLIMVNFCCTHDFLIYSCTGMYSTVRTYQNGSMGWWDLSISRILTVYHSNNINVWEIHSILDWHKERIFVICYCDSTRTEKTNHNQQNAEVQQARYWQKSSPHIWDPDM